MRESRFYREVIAEGRAEGRLLAQREAVLAALQERFGDRAGDEFAAAVNAIDDPAELTRLHRLAVRCARLDEFRAALSPR